MLFAKSCADRSPGCRASGNDCTGQLPCSLVSIQSPRGLRFGLNSFGEMLRRKGATNGDTEGAHRPGEDEQPLRAELFSISQLEEHARALAGWHDVSEVGAVRHGDRLLP